MVQCENEDSGNVMSCVKLHNELVDIANGIYDLRKEYYDFEAGLSGFGKTQHFFSNALSSKYRAFNCYLELLYQNCATERFDFHLCPFSYYKKTFEEKYKQFLKRFPDTSLEIFIRRELCNIDEYFKDFSTSELLNENVWTQRSSSEHPVFMFEQQIGIFLPLSLDFSESTDIYHVIQYDKNRKIEYLKSRLFQLGSNVRKNLYPSFFLVDEAFYIFDDYMKDANPKYPLVELSTVWQGLILITPELVNPAFPHPSIIRLCNKDDSYSINEINATKLKTLKAAVEKDIDRLNRLKTIIKKYLDPNIYDIPF